MSKRIFIFSLSIILIITSFANLNTAYATTKSSSGAIAWAASNVGKSVDFDNEFGAQCVDFIMAYYNYLGAEVSGGNAVDYTHNALPDGWVRIKNGTPRKGDILIYAGGTDIYYGHLGIYASEASSYHQANGVVYNTNKSYLEITSSRGAPYWGIIRPDFSDYTSTQPSTSQVQTTAVQSEISTSETDAATVTQLPVTVTTERQAYSTTTVVPVQSTADSTDSNTVEKQNHPPDNQSYSYVETKSAKPSKPKAVSIKKIKKGKGALILYWKKASSSSGYQLQYSRDKGFKSKKTINIKRTKSSYKLKNLKSKKYYYVRIRTYKKVKVNSVKKTYYSKWSKVKKVRIK